MKISRKNFIMKYSLLAGGVSAGANTILNAKEREVNEPKPKLATGFENKESFKLNVFSKTLQFLEINKMVNLAAEMGFDGIDLTVRPKGHVLPENVEKVLPKAVEAA